MCTKINPLNIKKYWKNQTPPKDDGPFLDQLFPPRAEILYDKKMKNDGVEKINIHNIDFRKSTELFKKKDKEGKKTEKYSELLQLKNLMNRKLGTLSGGELQRFAVAFSCIQNAEVYMFDEPT